jgi:hypothetical protein
VNGYCVVHAGKLDMQKIGRKGGRSRETAIRKATRVDDELRESAREVLAKALRGEDVDREQLAAARSLFSYRPDVAQVQQPKEQQHTGRGVFTIGDLIATGAELGIFSQMGAMDETTEHELYERMKARPLGGGTQDSEEVRAADPTGTGRPRAESATPEAPVPRQAPRAVLDAMTDEPGDGGDFDNSEAARLQRRYGDDAAAGFEWAP